MTTKQIDYCIELAHTLNFSRAAENMFVSQPTFSYQIKLMEEEVGFNIFERSGKGAALTPAGARAMISPLLYMNPGFGLISLVQGQLHVLSSYAENLGWGRLLCTWQMADRAGWTFITLAGTAGMLVISAALIAFASLTIRRKKTAVRGS